MADIDSYVSLRHFCSREALWEYAQAKRGLLESPEWQEMEALREEQDRVRDEQAFDDE